MGATLSLLSALGAGAEGEAKMSDGLSLSIFTIEVDRIPILAVQVKKHSEAEAIVADEHVRNQLSLLRSGGKPLCDDFSIFRIRLARPDEREIYYKNPASLLTGNGQLVVVLVDLDDPF
jgi:hypothetical protein